jgi:predicted secreted protein
MRAVDWMARSLLTTLLAVVVLAGLSIYAGVLLKLTVAGAVGLYFVLWWTLLFAVLPIRIRTQAEVGDITDGTEPGAPASPALRERAIWTTIAAGIVFVAVAVFFPLAGL